MSSQPKSVCFNALLYLSLSFLLSLFLSHLLPIISCLSAQVEDDLRAEMALTEAKKALKASNKKGSVYCITSAFLLTVNAVDIVDRSANPAPLYWLADLWQPDCKRAPVWRQERRVVVATGPHAHQVLPALL
jgi:hypothetical protein